MGGLARIGIAIPEELLEDFDRLIEKRGHATRSEAVRDLVRQEFANDQQWTWRENQALARRLHAAKLKDGACVEEIDYRATRGLDKSAIRALAQKLVWAQNHENIFVLGPTGVGKSFVACALTQKACSDGYSALYTSAAALFRDLAIAPADGSLRSLLARLSRIDVLVIDDWALAPLAEPSAATSGSSARIAINLARPS